MLSAEILDLARMVKERCIDKGVMLVTAESCTGGLISAAITSVPGSSDMLYGGYVTYANAAKTAMIGVSDQLIRTHGAVSEPVARAMAEGALATASVNLAIAVTGIAGPGGGSAEKPVGLVHLALASDHETIHRRVEYGDLGREAIRAATVRTALEMILEAVEDSGQSAKS